MTIKGKFKVDVFSCNVHITICDNVARSVNYYLRKYNHETITGEFHGYFLVPNPDSIGHYYIFIDSENITNDTINHEKSHLVEQILKDRCIHAHGECRAYLDGYISSQVHRFFNKRKIKIKK